MVLEQPIEVGGGEGVFDEAASHDAEGTGRDERPEKGIQEHGVASGRGIAISLPVPEFYQISYTLEGMATVGNNTGPINEFKNSAVSMTDPAGGGTSVPTTLVNSNTPGPYEFTGATSSSFSVTYSGGANGVSSRATTAATATNRITNSFATIPAPMPASSIATEVSAPQAAASSLVRAEMEPLADRATPTNRTATVDAIFSALGVFDFDTSIDSAFGNTLMPPQAFDSRRGNGAGSYSQAGKEGEER